ncbi:MAG: NAD-dependent epimerase/dehydratase family protein [Candidatus Chaera renei]|uniref:NAD-dependent epimerase/dehydratase family protein n=1 Tax=Candidatus Chaera renei TaxID=2506947 RepID=A0A4Q0AKH2_9BACT|nr:MAG: NAD-dependent epimerase/dehydratase family protein [Candidatus Chaera renei]
MATKILVTGANGFVGRHVVNELKAHRYEVLAMGGNDTVSGMDTINLDLTNPQALAQIDFSDISGVIHLAGLAAVGPSFVEPLRYLSVNAGIEINIFETLLTRNSKPRFLIVSSGSLYDPGASLPLDESSGVSPSSPYAVSKITQEELAFYYARRGFESIVARPFNHIGPGQGLGFIVPDLAVQVAAYKRGETNRILTGNLSAKRDYTDVRDIARAYRLLLEWGKAGEIYNVCSGTAISGKEILSKLVRAAGIRNFPVVTVDPSKKRPSDNPVIFGSHKKLTDATGWRPRISIDTTIKDVMSEHLLQKRL